MKAKINKIKECLKALGTLMEWASYKHTLSFENDFNSDYMKECINQAKEDLDSIIDMSPECNKCGSIDTKQISKGIIGVCSSTGQEMESDAQFKCNHCNNIFFE